MILFDDRRARVRWNRWLADWRTSRAWCILQLVWALGVLAWLGYLWWNVIANLITLAGQL